MHRMRGRRRQRGAVIVTVALALLFLLGFMGIALDFGRFFIVKSELQTAMDSCALAGAQELDGFADSITRATNAGVAAANLNAVNMLANGDDRGPFTASDLVFHDAGYAVTTTAAQARYLECTHTQRDLKTWLLASMNAFGGESSELPERVAARAVATRGSSQTTCPLPLAMKPKTGGVAPNYGFTPGEWVTLLATPGSIGSGQIGWANLDGSTSAAETVAEINGRCGARVGDTLGTPGAQANVADPWNARFGMYRGSSGPSTAPPDQTGYIYTTHNWPAGRNAYNGTPGSDPTGTAGNFVAKRASYASCANQDSHTNSQAITICQNISGLTLNSFNKTAAPGPSASGGFKTYGFPHRVVLVPVVNGSPMKIADYACMLMLQPLSIPMANVQLEFIGNAAAAGSPCTTNGLPGGTAGPTVPVLVR